MLLYLVCKSQTENLLLGKAVDTDKLDVNNIGIGILTYFQMYIKLIFSIH